MPYHFGKHLKIWKEFTPSCQVGINENFIKCKWRKNGIRNGYKSKKGLNTHNYLSRSRVGKIAWASLPAKTAFRSLTVYNFQDKLYSTIKTWCWWSPQDQIFILHVAVALLFPWISHFWGCCFSPQRLPFFPSATARTPQVYAGQWEICDSGRCDASLSFQPVSSCSEVTALARLTPFPSPIPSQTLMVDGLLSPTEGWICCHSKTLGVKTRGKNLFSISILSYFSGYPSYFPIYSIVSQQWLPIKITLGKWSIRKHSDQRIPQTIRISGEYSPFFNAP